MFFLYPANIKKETIGLSVEKFGCVGGALEEGQDELSKRDGK